MRLFNCWVTKSVPSFRTCFGIARLKSLITALAALNQVQGDKNCRVGKVKRFPPQDCEKMGILGVLSWFGGVPHPHS